MGQEEIISNASKDVVVLLVTIARMAERQGNVKKALQYYLECKKHRVNISVGSLPVLIEAYKKIGDLYRENGDKESIQTFSETLSMQKQWLSLKKVELASTIKTFRGVMYKSHAHEDALKSFKTSQRDLASLYFKIGILYRDDFQKALDAFLEALHYSELEYGPNHLQLASIYDRIGQVHMEGKNYHSALHNFQKALGIRREQLGDDNLHVADSLFQIGLVLELNEDCSRALEAFYEVLRIKIVRLGPNNSALGSAYCKLADIYRKLGDLDEAKRYYEESLKLKKIELYHSRQNLRIALDFDSTISVQKNTRDATSVLTALDEISQEKGEHDDKFSASLRMLKNVQRMSTMQSQDLGITDDESVMPI